MDQAVALPIGCPSYNQALDLADPWAAQEERVARGFGTSPVALRIDGQLALAVVGAVAAGLHNIASTAVCATCCPAN